MWKAANGGKLKAVAMHEIPPCAQAVQDYITRGVEMSKATLQAKEKVLQDEIEKYRGLQKGSYTVRLRVLLLMYDLASSGHYIEMLHRFVYVHPCRIAESSC